MAEAGRYMVKSGRRLRTGYTTGSCAAAAAKAAAMALLSGERPAEIELKTPSGVVLYLEVEALQWAEDSVTCAVRKDAGDDPDVTHNMLIYATVSRIEAGLQIEGGQGIGRVTRDGLQCPKGEAAINPVPREMILRAMRETAEEQDYQGGLRAIIWAPAGEEVAQNTFNARLGIVGGISILGTSGLVEPMSERALIATIQAEIDLRRAEGAAHLVLAPGNYGVDFARDHFSLPLAAAVKCSNFIGEALDYAVYKGFREIILLGHAGKLVKLAAGVMQTHSAVADGRMEVLACHGALCGLAQKQVRQLFDCISVEEADGLLVDWGVQDAVWRSIAERVQFQLDYRVKENAAVVFAAFLHRGVVMQTEQIQDKISKYKGK